MGSRFSPSIGVLPVGDRQRACALYAEALGLEVVGDSARGVLVRGGPGARLLALVPGTPSLLVTALCCGQGPPEVEAVRFAACLIAWRRAGGEVLVREGVPPFGVIARDPWGNRVRIGAPAAQDVAASSS